MSIPSGSALQVHRAAVDKYNDLLMGLPCAPIWEAERAVFEPGGGAIKLFNVLDDLPDVGIAKATKLMAAKRPHLIPIQDACVQEELVLPKGRFWLPMYDQLRMSPCVSSSAALQMVRRRASPCCGASTWRCGCMSMTVRRLIARNRGFLASRRRCHSCGRCW